ncbi:DUF4230 domain-containing protein [Butyrivibrio sp. AE3004]|uniref:DUF4230 domain-containing protein n=1 Tax=Butyrivibrio sp. AE3004 TaxID=1506994 RepID=UPI000493DB50|nr:DUF4230 domain-containing protein [Butyrivibrio sp. AE3004]
MNIFEIIKKIIYPAIIAISVILMIILVVSYVKNLQTSKDDALEKTPIATLKPKEDKAVVTVNTETIREGLEGMGILMTQEYYFTQVEKYTKEKKIFDLIPSSSEMMYSYDGAVMAGIDFAKITIGKDDNRKTLNVNLPKSEIQAVTIDKDTFKVFSEKDSLWNPLKLEDYNMSLSEFEDAAKQKALDSGILERSDEQAKNLVLNFIKSIPQTKEYEIVFE